MYCASMCMDLKIFSESFGLIDFQCTFKCTVLNLACTSTYMGIQLYGFTWKGTCTYTV